MAIDFPSNPTPGQSHTSGNSTWTWDGAKWNLVAGTIQGPMGTGTQVIYSQMYV